MSDAAPARFTLDRRALLRSFDRAGPAYDAAAWLQRRVALELLERLDFFGVTPRCVLDIGAGTCHAAALLAQRYRDAEVLAVDLAPGMLRAAPGHWWQRRRYRRICADAYALPLQDGCADLIYSNLMVQWCDGPAAVFGELSRVLRPGGLLVFSSFGPESLTELREAWSHADGAVHVSEFADMPEVAGALMQAGFVEPVLDIEPLRQHYPDALALMRELKQIGAHNAATGRTRGLTGRARLLAMTGAYEQWRTPAGLPATFQLLYGAAFNGPRDGRTTGPAAPADSARLADSASTPTEFVVPLERLRRRPP